MPTPETRNFIYAVQNQPELVANAVRNVLRQDTPIPSDESRVVVNLITWSVDYGGARRTSPPWLNVGGLFKMASEVSASPVWSNLMTPDVRPKLELELNTDMPEQRIAKANATFVTSAITLGLLAAATGDNVENCIQLDRNPLNSEFARQLGYKYHNPPQDIEEYMDRISELIPDPDVADTDSSDTLLHYFTEYNAFTARKTLKRCPATHLTRQILDEMGRQLHNNDEYRERFKATITNSITTDNS